MVITRTLLLAGVATLFQTAHAYDSHTLMGETLDDTVVELSHRLGSQQPLQCSLKQSYFDEDSVSYDFYYTLDCPDARFFLKNTPSSQFDDNALYLSQVGSYCSSASCHLALPIAEILLKSPSKTLFYTAYPHIEGETLDALKDRAFDDPNESERLNRAYFNVGHRLGSLHNFGLASNTEKLETLRSSTIHRDLHDGNVMVKPDGDIVFVDPEGLASSVYRPALLTEDLFMALHSLLSMSILLADEDKLERLFPYVREYYQQFSSGYCSTLYALDEKDCRIQLKNYTHATLTGEILFEDENGNLQPQILTPQELEKRLERL